MMSIPRWRSQGIGETPDRRRAVRPRASAMLWERCEPRTLLTISIAGTDVTEPLAGTSYATFNVTPRGPPPARRSPLTSPRSTTPAKAGVDYQPVQGGLAFAPGQTTPETIFVPIIGGVTPSQSSRRFTVDLSNPTNDTIEPGQGQGVGTIAAPPMFSIGDVTVTQGSSGPSQATLTVTLSSSDSTPAQPVTIDYATADGSATAGTDYEAASGTLVFANGQTSQTISVPLIAGASAQAGKTFTVLLDNPSGAIVDQGHALVTIPADPVTTPATNPPGQAPVNTPAPGPDIGDSTATATPTSTPTPTPPQAPTAPQAPTPSPTPTPTPSPTSTPMPQPTPLTPSQHVEATTAFDPSTLVVTNTNDDGAGSLRQAIETANAHPGADRITFDLTGPGPFTITPNSPLPEVTDPLTIDAETLPGYGGTPMVEINGSHAGAGANGLTISGGGSAVQGLAIDQFAGSGIVLKGNGSNRVQADTLGAELSGGAPMGNGYDGVLIDGSKDNVIGGPDAGAGDLISDNGIVGVEIVGASASGNVVAGDLIGTDRFGTRPLGNHLGGVFIDEASGNTIGGTAVGARDVISANGGSGIEVSGAGASTNVILRDLIGTDATGKHALGNTFDGIFIDGAPGNAIGGTAPGAGNLISSNGGSGIQLFGSSASANQVLGNLIGTDVSGLKALGNKHDGVFINGAPGNTVGGTVTGARNVIAASGNVGVQLTGPGESGNSVQGNLVGSDVFGILWLRNRTGIDINNVLRATNTIANNRGANAIANLVGGETSAVRMSRLHHPRDRAELS